MPRKMIVALIALYLTFALVWHLVLSALLVPSDADVVNDILRSEPGCAAPCWHSMEPGVTTFQEVLDFRETFSAGRMSSWDRFRFDPERLDADFDWYDEKYDLRAAVIVRENRVKTLTFAPLFQEFPLALVNKPYGPPSHYGASQYDIQLFAVESRHYARLFFVYPDEGMVLEAEFPLEPEQRAAVRSACEFQLEWDIPPIHMALHLTEPGAPDEMMPEQPSRTISEQVPPLEPWTGQNPIPLTHCPE